MKGKKIIEEAEAVGVIKSAEFMFVNLQEENPVFKSSEEEISEQGKLVLNVSYSMVNSRRGGRLHLQSKEELVKFFSAYGLDYGYHIDQEDLGRLKNSLMVLHEKYENREKRQAKGEWVHPVESAFVKKYNVDDESVYDEVKQDYQKYVNLSVFKN